MISVLTQRLVKFSTVKAVAWRDRFWKGRRPAPTIAYFAYGANLHMKRFDRYRMNVVPVGVAKLPGYRLTFDFPCEYEGKAFASVSADPAAEVWGYLYRIDRLSLFLLDTMEWAIMGQYRRIEVEVETRDGKRERAQVYQARCPRAGLTPSVIYRDLIVEAAVLHGFPESYRRSIAEHPAKTDFPLDPSFSFLHPHRPRWFAKPLRRFYLWHDRFREKVCDWLRF